MYGDSLFIRAAVGEELEEAATKYLGILQRIKRDHPYSTHAYVKSCNRCHDLFGDGMAWAKARVFIDLHPKGNP